MPEDPVGAELTIVLAQPATHALALPHDLLAQVALSTGVMRAHLFEMAAGSDDTQYLYALESWPRKHTRDITVGVTTTATYRSDGATTPRLKAHSKSADWETNASEIDLDTFLAEYSTSSVMLPIMVEDEWLGFIQLHEGSQARASERVWERAEIASLERVAVQLGERLCQQKHSIELA